jgi:hypothetical protein
LTNAAANGQTWVIKATTTDSRNFNFIAKNSGLRCQSLTATAVDNDCVEQSLAMYVKQIVRIGNEEWFYFNRTHDCGAIIAILAAIATPSYLQYLRKGHRTTVQSEMMNIAQIRIRKIVQSLSIECNDYIGLWF